MRWRNWNWLDLALLPLLLAVMRICWLVPWAAVIQRFLTLDVDLTNAEFSLQPALGVAIVLGVPLLSFWLARAVTAGLPMDEEMALGTQPTIPAQSRIVLALGGVVTLLVVLWWHFASAVYPLWDLRWLIGLGQLLIHVEQMQSLPVWFALLMLIFLWLRGLLDSSKTLGHDDVWSSMLSGIVAIVFYLIATSAFGATVPADFSNWIVLFFAAGMTALAFSGLKITVGLNWALSGNRRNTKTPPLTRYWLISVGAVVGGLLTLGIGIGLLVAPEQIARLLALLNGIFKLLWSVVTTIILAISYVVFMIVFYIIEILRPLLERLFGEGENKTEMLMPGRDNAPLPEPPVATALNSVPDIYRWIGLIIFLIVVALIFAFVVRRLRMAREVESDEVRESILSSDLLQNQLAKLWSRLWGGRKEGEGSPFLSLEGETDTRRVIRQRYQQLLTVGGERGLARQKAQTPREYRTNLTTSVTSSSEPLEKMTERYNHARYAPEPPDEASSQEVQQLWNAIEKSLAPSVEPIENKSAEKKE